jgi:transcriptional regulator with XRE-family HTH domain
VVFRRRRLAQRRKAVGYSQEQLAEQLGVERSTVVRWERGETEPQPWLRPKVAHTLEISLDQLDNLLSEADDVELGGATGGNPRTTTDSGRDAAGLSQAQVANAVGTTQVHVWQMWTAPGVLTGWLVPASPGPEPRITISGSRAEGTDGHVIDYAVRSLGQLLVRHRCRVVHGPVGIGIEVMTHIADHYRPPGLGAATGVFGRPNVVRDADFVLVIGGGIGTQAEFDLAASMGKKVIPMPKSGGTAARVYMTMQRQPELRGWISEEDFAALGASPGAEDYVRIVERLLACGGQTEAQR